MALFDFDEEKFPFLLIAGYSCISIINVKTGEHKPLIISSLTGIFGLTPVFVKEEEYGQYIHWANNLKDPLLGTYIVTYSYMALK